jgi:hypothetical protein
MIKNQRINNVYGYVAVIATLLIIFSGCSTLKSSEKDSSFGSAVSKERKDMPVYYDFGDVLVPKDLKIDKKSSFVYSAPGFSAGVLVLSGRVDVGSLFSFFEENMAKDNWKTVVSFKSERTVMLFQKENRWCIINITDGQFSTDIEIWVAPTVTEGARGLLK